MVDKSVYACYKRYNTLEGARAFLEEYEEAEHLKRRAKPGEVSVDRHIWRALERAVDLIA
jgi:hypothetical protein